MRKKILLATSAVAMAAGSIFAFANEGGERVVTKTATEQCPPECCNGTGNDCGPDQCGKNTEECCEK